MVRMTEEQKAARKAEREAKQKAELKAYIDKVVAEAPPLTDEQANRISVLLYPQDRRWPPP